MLMLARSEGMVICTALVLVGLVATSCASAETPAPTVRLPAAPTATPVAVATPTPVEEDMSTPTAQAVGTPAVSPDDMPRISLEELKALMDSGANITILDNRPGELYEMGHIKGAISSPWKPGGLAYIDLEMATLEYVPAGTLVITYCDCGPGEADSADIALQLIEMGVAENVKVLADPSIEGWIEAGYPMGE